jgi:hypothetical protein
MYLQNLQNLQDLQTAWHIEIKTAHPRQGIHINRKRNNTHTFNPHRGFTLNICVIPQNPRHFAKAEQVLPVPHRVSHIRQAIDCVERCFVQFVDNSLSLVAHVKSSHVAHFRSPEEQSNLYHPCN